MEGHGGSAESSAGDGSVLLAAEPRTKATTLTDRLVTAIAVGEYSPGERLPPERELAASLGVSRQTVRQALQQVTELGLIETRRGRAGGAFVAEMSWEDVAPDVARRTLETEIPRLQELYDYRCMVEGMIARAAAQRRTADDVEALEAALADFRAAGSMTEARSADRRLHGLVTAAAGNPHLTSLSAHLTAAATLGFGAEPYTRDFYDEALAQHTELVGHVVRGDAEAANACAQQHFTLTLETMRAALRRAQDA